MVITYHYNNLKHFLEDRGLYSPEGGLDGYEYQKQIFLNLLDDIEYKKGSRKLNILEIGFNTGLS